MKIRIKECELRESARDADAIVAGLDAPKKLSLSYEIEIASGEGVAGRLDEVLHAVQKVTREAFMVKKLIPEEKQDTDILSRRW